MIDESIRDYKSTVYVFTNSTEGVPIYNVPRGDTTGAYGYEWKNSISSWDPCRYESEEVSLRYGLPHPVVTKNVRLLQDRPEELKTLSELKTMATSEKVFFLVKDSRYLIDSSQFLCIEDTGVVLRVSSSRAKSEVVAS